MKNKGFRWIKGIIIAYLTLTVIVPLIMLMSKVGIEEIRSVTSSAQFWPMLGNSCITALASTAISVVLAFGLAYCIHRTQIKFRSFWILIFTVPMLIPSISHGMGLVLLFGDNGILTNMFGIQIGLFGYPGIIMGSVLYSFPAAFLMLQDAFAYEDFSVYESAQVLGIPARRQFRDITLPNMRPALVSASLGVFTMVFTDYGVPLMTGGKVMTLPVYMYREVIGLMNFSNGAFVGLILLLPAVIAFLFDLKHEEAGNTSTIVKKFAVRKSKARDIAAYLLCTITAISVCLPIVAFAVLSFVKKYPVDMSFSLDNIQKTFQAGAKLYLRNSLTIALLTALCGTTVAYLAAYITARNKQTLSNKALRLISMVTMAIPGIVLGLSYVFAFRGMPFYRTIFMLVMVNMIHFFASPYLMGYNSLLKYSSNLEDVSDSLGIGKFRMIGAVYIPETFGTIMEMYSYFFVNCMITISAVSFLANFRTMPAALLIPQLEAQSFLEGTAIVSLLILAINLVMKGIVYGIKKWIY